jgi:hypothetical protein
MGDVARDPQMISSVFCKRRDGAHTSDSAPDHAGSIAQETFVTLEISVAYKSGSLTKSLVNHLGVDFGSD